MRAAERRRGQARVTAPGAMTLTAMDRSVKPGDDFFDYVNGAWDKRTADRRPTAPSPASIPCSTTRSSSDVRAIVEDMAKNPRRQRQARPADRRLLRAAGWTKPAIERAGTAPLKPYLAAIAAVKTRGRAGRPVRRARLRLARSASASIPIPRIRPAMSAYRRPGRPRHAEPRLLPAQGRQIRRLSRGLSRLYRRDRAARRDRRCRSHAPTASSRSKPRSPRSTGRPSAAATSRRSTTR